MSSKFCTGCGGEMASAAVFCSSCGKQRFVASAMPAIMQQPQAAPPPPSPILVAEAVPVVAAQQPQPSQQPPRSIAGAGVPAWLTTDWAPAAIIAALTAIGTIVLSALLLVALNIAVGEADIPVMTIAMWVASITFGAAVKTTGAMDGENVAIELSILSLPLAIAPALISWLVARRLNLRVVDPVTRPWLFPAKLGVVCGAAAIIVTKMTSLTLSADGGSLNGEGKVQLLATSGRAFLITTLFVAVLHRLTGGMPVGAQRLSPRVRGLLTALPDALISFGVCAVTALLIGGGYALSQFDLPSDGYAPLAIGVLAVGITAGGLVATAAQGAPIEVGGAMDADSIEFSGTLFSAPIPGWMKLGLLIAPASVAWVANRSLQRRPASNQVELSQRVLSSGVMFGVVTFVFSALSRLTLAATGNTAEFDVDNGAFSLGVNSVASLAISSCWGLAGAAVAAHLWGKPRGMTLMPVSAGSAPIG